MTKENKLALIVAFALILGVSVLLSDHLSSARMAVAGEVRDDSRLPETPLRPIRTLDDIARSQQEWNPGGGQPSERELALAEPVDGPEASGGDAGAIQSFLNRLGSAPTAMGTSRSTEASGRESPDGHEPLILDQRVVPREPVLRGRGSATPPAGNAASGTTPGAAVRTHTVAANESLYKIAERYYGDGNLWRELARANEGRVGADGSVRSGVTLRIPAREGTASATPAATPAATPTATPSTPPANTRPQTQTQAQPTPQPQRPAQPDRSRTYTVARGDTLGDISMSQLGTSRRWREIYELNRDRIDDPNHVPAGTVLVLPSSNS
ncbi:MAG: LysM domain-containing protein [Phycisphaerales bacterium]